ncbi:uncharacterized protein LOC132756725 [Ruditapes philippinarum]|uniref:uncharacterized protein LOC132756725 n=1 Tax=Ruditapes philippinarum TaxID=129788 RepID=UPI00295B7356|nr:uncharacterized protein LOC132756725 [Ruditapes philippinarum]
MIFYSLISTAVFHFAHGITLSCVPDVPRYLSNMTCTCRNPTKNGVEWRLNSQIVNTCSGTKDKCFPPSLQYTSSVSSDEFYIGVSPYSYKNCATYSCRDKSTGEEVSATTSIADFGQSSITAQEPGANTNGQILVNTGCVFPTSDITVTWYKIENGTEEDFTSSRPSPIQLSDRSDCTRTCNSETDRKVASGFTHTEYTGSDYVEVVYKVTVTHNLYIEEVFTWTSSKYRLKAGTTVPPTASTTSKPTHSTTIIVLSVVGGAIVILIICIIVCILLRKKSNREKKYSADPENEKMPQVDINVTKQQ